MIVLFLKSCHAGDTEGARAYCTEGFVERDRLVSNVFQLRSMAEVTRLIPEMNFVCNGVVVGFKVAVVTRGGKQPTVIQVWRRNCTQCPDPPAYVYHKESDVTISDAVCVNGLTRVTGDVFHCNLNETAQISVQPGDILGLELPTRRAAATRLYFATVPRGPTNYGFTGQMLSSPAMLANRSSKKTELPQITLDIHPGIELAI